MSNMALRASESANDYAQKKREQIEAAKRLREERKQASLLKNVGEKFVLQPSNSGNGGANGGAPGGGMLMSTSSSGFSQKSSHSGGNGGGYNRGGGNGGGYNRGGGYGQQNGNQGGGQSRAPEPEPAFETDDDIPF